MNKGDRAEQSFVTEKRRDGDELYEIFFPKEFAPTIISLDLTPETEKAIRNRDNQRFGIRVEISLDPRKEYHKFGYSFAYPEDMGRYEYIFEDDYYRAINGRFRRKDGRQMGGRDDRDFYIPREREEVLGELRRLEFLKKNIEAEIKKTNKDNGLPNKTPEKLAARISLKNPYDFSLPERDDEGKLVIKEKERIVAWMGEEDTTLCTYSLSKGEAEKMVHDFEEGGLIPDDVAQLWKERLEEIRGKRHNLKIDILEQNLKKVCEEIREYDQNLGNPAKADVKVNVYRLEGVSSEREDKRGRREATEKVEGRGSGLGIMAEAFGGSKKEGNDSVKKPPTASIIKVAPEGEGQEEKSELREKLVDEIEILVSMIEILSKLSLVTIKNAKNIEDFSKGLQKIESQIKENMANLNSLKGKIDALKMSIESLFAKLISSKISIPGQVWINKYREIWKNIPPEIEKNNDAIAYMGEGLTTKEAVVKEVKKILPKRADDLLKMEGNIGWEKMIEDALAQLI